ncbi:MAG: tetratricopeptide repeat protein [Flavobacterium sp.]|uniref:tetratricopeptide repeat protein n=1 Tax=Flavobacterium sp. TaxID=239 RepID=UPI00391C3AC8
MRLLFAFLSLFISLHTSGQNEDKILFEKGMALQYAHYDTDLIGMLLSSDTLKLNTAERIINQLQKQAIHEYDLLIKRFPKSELLLDAKYQKAEALFSVGLNSEAKEMFLQVIAVNPKKGKSLLKLAYIALDEKNYAEALKYLKERKELNPTLYCGTEYETEKKQIEYIEEQCKIGLAKK